MRTKTPAPLKWLLNERAALLGHRDRFARSLAKLEAEALPLREALQRLEARAGSYRAQLASVEARLAALERSIAAVAPLTDPAAGGTVRAIGARYGGRGGLTRFLLAKVAAAGMPGISTKALVEAVAAHFQIPIVEPSELLALSRNSVQPALRDLARQGRITASPRRAFQDTTWSVPTVSLLADVAARRTASAATE